MTSLLWLMLSAALVASVVTDLTTRRIFDVVTLPTAALALGWRFWCEGFGDLAHGLASGLAGAALAAAIPCAWALMRRLGWGDVKLMAVVGCCLGYPLAAAASLFVVLAGIAQGAVSLWLGDKRPMPYGVAIALGCVATMGWAS